MKGQRLVVYVNKRAEALRLAPRLEGLARQEDRSLSAIICTAVLEYLDRREAA
jgi:predicted transcriptional regulator